MSLKKRITGIAKGIVTGIAVDHLMNQKDPVFDLKLLRKQSAVQLDNNTLIPISEFAKLSKLTIDQSIFLRTTNPLIEVRISFNPKSISMGKYAITPEAFCLLLVDLLSFVKSLDAKSLDNRNLSESINDAVTNFYSLYSQHLQTKSPV